MKISWTSLKISIAGARLSHLVQKDRIWDHGSMAEQVRIIFHLVHKVKTVDNYDLIKKLCSISCFNQLKNQENVVMNDLVIKEIAITEVHPGKLNKPDLFVALIKGSAKDAMNNNTKEFSSHCSFVRQGEWWILDDIRNKIFYKN